MEHCELLIVGGGAAGISAALSARAAGARDILLVDRRNMLGGVLPQCIHRGFGQNAPEGELTGPEYAKRLAQALHATEIMVLTETTVVSVSGDRTAVLSSRGCLRDLGFERLILASGCREKAIGSLNIAGTRPAGIFTAGQAQELMNLQHLKLGDTAVVVGSGDLGMIVARRFTLRGGTVAAVVEKEPRYGGMARNYHRCMESCEIPLLCSAVVTQVLGIDRVCGVHLRHLESGQEETLPCDTLLIAAGLVPERGLLASVGAQPWVSLCGNCSKIHELVDSAVAEAEQVGAAMGGRRTL